MGVATWVTMRVVVTTPLTVTPSLASEPEPPPLPGTLTGMLLWSDTSVMGLTRPSVRWMGSDDFAHVQTDMQASIDSQINMMHVLFGHFGINPDAWGGVGCPGMSQHLSHFIPNFSSYLVTYLAHWSYHYRCHDC
jgi:hypothetical protein